MWTVDDPTRVGELPLNHLGDEAWTLVGVAINGTEFLRDSFDFGVWVHVSFQVSGIQRGPHRLRRLPACRTTRNPEMPSARSGLAGIAQSGDAVGSSSVVIQKRLTVEPRAARMPVRPERFADRRVLCHR